MNNNKEINKILQVLDVLSDASVNTIKLARAFKYDVLELNKSNDSTYKSSLEFNEKYVQNENENRGTIYLDTIDPYNRRVAIAYHLSNVLLLSSGLIESDFLSLLQNGHILLKENDFQQPVPYKSVTPIPNSCATIIEEGTVVVDVRDYI